jgi:hypothetical protein
LIHTAVGEWRRRPIRTQFLRRKTGDR